MVFLTRLGEHSAVEASRNGRTWDVEPSSGMGGVARTAKEHLDEIRPVALRAIQRQLGRAIQILEKSKRSIPSA
jgi:hypothetical protein